VLPCNIEDNKVAEENDLLSSEVCSDQPFRHLLNRWSKKTFVTSVTQKHKLIKISAIKGNIHLARQGRVYLKKNMKRV
jgi:hypothetical protein